MVDAKKPANYRSSAKHLRDPEIQAWRTVMALFQHVYRKLEKGLQQDGYHYSRFQIFFIIYFEGGQSAADLAKKLLVSRGNISTFIKRLEQDKCIYVCPLSPSMSRPIYQLAPKAVKDFESILPKHFARVKKFMPKISPATIQELKSIVEDLAE